MLTPTWLLSGRVTMDQHQDNTFSWGVFDYVRGHVNQEQVYATDQKMNERNEVQTLHLVPLQFKLADQEEAPPKTKQLYHLYLGTSTTTRN